LSHKQQTQNGTEFALYLWDDKTPVVQHTDGLHRVFNAKYFSKPYWNSAGKKCGRRWMNVWFITRRLHIDTLYATICIVTMETDGRDVTALYL